MSAQGEGSHDATICYVRDTPITDLARRKLDQYLDGFHLPLRSESFVTTLDADLDLELGIVRPRIVVPLGDAATRRFLGDVCFELVHGLPHAIPHPFIESVVPCYDPMAGLASPDLYARVEYDFARLVKHLDRAIAVRPKDTLPGTYVEDTQIVLLRPDEPYLALSTEGDETAPWGVSYAQTPGTGHVVRPPLVARLQDALHTYDGTVLLHHALHDLPVLRALGIAVPRYLDLAILASLLGESLDLVTLAYRLCGMALSTPEEILASAHRQQQHAKLHGVAPRAVTVDDVDPETRRRYIGRRADAILRLYPLLQSHIIIAGLDDTATRDLLVLKKIDAMRQAGDFVDLTALTFVSSSIWQHS